MLSSILSLIGILPKALDTVNGITNAIANEKIAGINATTQQEQIASQERVAALSAQRDLLIAEAGQSKLPIYMQTLIASGPAFILCKIFFYDELGFGSTDIPHDSPLWTVILSVVGLYTLHDLGRTWMKSK